MSAEAQKPGGRRPGAKSGGCVLAAVIVAVLAVVGGSWVLRPNAAEYRLDNRFAIARHGGEDHFYWVNVGVPGAPYQGEFGWFIELDDGTEIDLRNPVAAAAVVVARAVDGGRLIAEGGPGSWPKEARHYQIGIDREFVVVDGRIVSFSLHYSPERPPVCVRSVAGRRLQMPLSRPELEELLGAGGAYRTFVRQ